MQWDLPPLWTKGGEVVNSLEGEAAPGCNLFLQGDLCSESRIFKAARVCPPEEGGMVLQPDVDGL